MGKKTAKGMVIRVRKEQRIGENRSRHLEIEGRKEKEIIWQGLQMGKKRKSCK